MWDAIDLPFGMLEVLVDISAGDHQKLKAIAALKRAEHFRKYVLGIRALGDACPRRHEREV